MPEIGVFAFGIRGVVPNAWRKPAGYGGILAVGSEAERAGSAKKVLAAIHGYDRAIVAFDMNELTLPQ